MGFFDKIVKPAGIVLGGAALGGMLFPETFGGLTGGLFGASQSTPGQTNLLGFGIGGTGAAGAASSSVFSNPTVLSAAILSGTSLLSGLYGSSSADELSQAQLEEEKRQFDAKLALEREQLAQALEIAKIQAGGAGSGAGAAAAAQLKIAKANAIKSAAENKAVALQLPLAGRKAKTEAAQTTGIQSGAFFNQLIPGLQRGALAAAGG